MTRPVLKERKRHSDAVDVLMFDDDSIMHGCTWPGCAFVAESMSSVTSHYKVHSGKAAQRRRGERRVKGIDAHDRVIDLTLSILDQAKELLDALDALEDEISTWKEKADRLDRLMSAMGDD